MKYSNILAVTLSTALMAACGGGGGGDSTTNTAAPTATAALNSSNQRVAEQEVIATTSSTSSAATLTGAQTSDESALFTFALSQLGNFGSHFASAKESPILTGVVSEKTTYCAFGGTTTVSVSDTDNSGTLSSGDTGKLTYNNCNEGMKTTHGAITLIVNNMVGTYGSSAYSSNISATFNGMSLASGPSKTTLNGSISLIENVTGVNSRTDSLTTPSLTLAATYAGSTRSRTLGIYSETRTTAPSTTYGYTTSYSARGTVTSSALSSQMVSFKTETPFTSKRGDAYPSGGVMVISGTAGSKIKLTALSNSLVKEELDANGDGIYESNATVFWNTLQ